MRSFVREQLLRWCQRWDERGGPLWRANPRRVAGSLLTSLSGARVTAEEKATVSKVIQSLIRYRLLLDYSARGERVTSASGTADASWADRLLALESDQWQALRCDTDVPEHIRVSFPERLYKHMQQRFGADSYTACEKCNEEPSMFLRVNSRKASPCRTNLLSILHSQGFEAEASSNTEWGILVTGGPLAVTQLQEYFDGVFEVQDESSQLVAGLVQCQPGDTVVDLCAGAGGKALAVLERLGVGGTLVLHEPRGSALRRAARRLERAGADRGTTSITLASSTADLHCWTGVADWVLVDAPCSNSGSLRRHPECKYRLFESDEGSAELAAMLLLQRQLLCQAKALIHVGGTLVYSTCSLLLEENEAQVRWAESELGLKRLPVAFTGCFPPAGGGRDGFFAAVFQKGP